MDAAELFASAAYKAPPAGGAPLPAEIAGSGVPLPEWDMFDMLSERAHEQDARVP